jgi:hypothetical protein
MICGSEEILLEKCESSKAKGGVTTDSADTLRRRVLGKQN